MFIWHQTEREREKTPVLKVRIFHRLNQEMHQRCVELRVDHWAWHRVLLLDNSDSYVHQQNTNVESYRLEIPLDDWECRNHRLKRNHSLNHWWSVCSVTWSSYCDVRIRTTCEWIWFPTCDQWFFRLEESTDDWIELIDMESYRWNSSWTENVPQNDQCSTNNHVIGGAFHDIRRITSDQGNQYRWLGETPEEK